MYMFMYRLYVCSRACTVLGGDRQTTSIESTNQPDLPDCSRETLKNMGRHNRVINGETPLHVHTVTLRGQSVQKIIFAAKVLKTLQLKDTGNRSKSKS